MVLKPDNIPETMRDLPRWVVFKVLDDRKVPLSHTGGEAKANDPSTWSTLPEVLKAIEYEVGDYPALALSVDYQLRFFDLDHCFTDDGSLTPLAAQIVAAAPNTYIERSASGNGLHVLAWMSGEKMPSNRVCDGLEVYGTTPRFCIFTGDLYHGSALDINEEPQTLVQLVQSLAGAPQGNIGVGVGGTTGERVLPTKKQIAAKKQWFWKTHRVVRAGERNNILFQYAAKLQNFGYTPVDIAEELWEFNAAACQPPFNHLNPTDAAEVDKIVRSATTNVPRGVPGCTVAPKTHTEPVDQEVAAKAREIYQYGRFVEYCHEVWRTIWHGDEHILDLVLHAAACLYITNASDGINIHIAGNTQSGKSAAAKTALKFVHPVNAFTGTFSKMGLFSGLFQEKMLIFSDDTQFDDEQAGVLRGALTNWRVGSSRITMVEKKWVNATIPPRINLILTSVESVTAVTHDGQDESRFMTVEIRRDAEKIRIIQGLMQQNAHDITPELQLIHAVWAGIPNTDVLFHRAIDPDDTVPLREWARYLDLIRAHAFLSGRTTTTDDDVTAVNYLVELSRRMLAADRPGLTHNEAVVLDVIKKGGNGGMSVNAIHTMLIGHGRSITLQTVHNCIKGRGGTWGKYTGGLLTKDERVWCDYNRETSMWLIGYLPPATTNTHFYQNDLETQKCRFATLD